MATCLIGLGANLGPRAQMLDEVVARLDALSNVSVTAHSTWHESAPAGGPIGQPRYLNGVVRIETGRTPHELLAHLQQIETDLGRERQIRWDARTIDLDLLLYDEQVLRTPTLEIPHPRMAVRRFVLEPAREIAAELIHPTSGWTIAQLVEHLVASPRYIAVCGLSPATCTRFAAAAAEQLAGRVLSVPTRVVGSGGSPSPVFQRELELVGRRGERVVQAIDEASRRWLVSDFWLPQSLAYGEALFAAAENQRLRECWQSATERVPPARFVVALSQPVDALWSEMRQSNPSWNDLDAARFRQHAAALDALVHQTGWGPVLHFDEQIAQDEQSIVAEIVAAAQASDDASVN